MRSHASGQVFPAQKRKDQPMVFEGGCALQLIHHVAMKSSVALLETGWISQDAGNLVGIDRLDRLHGWSASPGRKTFKVPPRKYDISRPWRSCRFCRLASALWPN